MGDEAAGPDPAGPDPSGDAERVVREFWRLMATNDFRSVAAVLAEDLLVEWPQSGERFRGPDAFVRVNAEYPTAGLWAFTLNRVVAA